MPVATTPENLNRLYADHQSWLRAWLRKKLGNADQAADLDQAKAIAQATMDKIDLNFKLTFWLNSLILLGAGFGLYGPMATSFLRNGTTVGILVNALSAGE